MARRNQVVVLTPFTLAGAMAPGFQAHVYEYPGRRREPATHARQRHVHAHVVLRLADGGEVIVPEIPAEVSTGLRRTEQHRADHAALAVRPDGASDHLPAGGAQRVGALLVDGRHGRDDLARQ